MQTKRGKREQKRSGNVRKGAPGRAASKGAVAGDVPYEEHRRAEEVIRIQRDLGVSLSSVSDLNETFRLCMEAAFRLDGVDCGGVYIVDELTGDANLAYHMGFPSHFIDATSHYGFDTPQAKLVAAGTPFHGHYEEEAGMMDTAQDDVRRRERLRALSIVPVKYGGRAVAALNVASYTCDELSNIVRSALESLASQIGGAIVRVQAQTASREARMNFQTLFESLEDFLFILGTDGSVLHWNPVVEERLGYSWEEIARMHVLDFHPPDRREEAAHVFADMLSGRTSECPIPLMTRGGALIPVETKVARGKWSNREVFFGICRDITDRRQAEPALRESEERFRGLVEAMAEGVVLIAPDGRIVQANPAAEHILGLSRSEITGRRYVAPEWKILRPDGTPMPPEEMAGPRAMKEKRMVRDDVMGIVRSDGSVSWINVGASPLFNGAGEFTGIVGTFADITPLKHAEMALRKASDELEERVRERTAELAGANDRLKGEIEERRRAEQALEESERRYRTVFESTGTAMAMMEEDGTMSLVNAGFEKLSGYSRQELENNKISLDFISEADLERLKTYHRMRRIDPGSAPTEYEFQFVDKEGSRKDVLATVAPIPGTMRSVVSLLDITERKRAENALRESDERFRQLAESIDEVFWMVTPDQAELVYVSPAYEKVWGRTCESAYQDPASWLEGVHPEDRGRVDFKVPLEEREWEYRVVRPDGSIRWVRDRGFPVRDESGRVYRIAGIAEDITERRRIEQESRYRLLQLVQADRLASLGRLVAGVAHEINNPNSFIAYNTPILQETWSIFEPILADYAAAHPDWRKGAITFDDLCRDMREIIEAIKTGSDRIKRVVTQLRDFARLDEGREMRPVQINEVVKGTLAIVGAHMRQSASRIEVSLGDNLPEIEGYFHKLEQVVANLLINAAGALPSRDTGRIWIRTRYVERLRAVLIEIEDNGTGMVQATLERIFEPFFTTRRDMGGTGLGLSVSYGLIEEHHGRIAVLSRPGLGTRFTVFLPVDRNVKLDLQPLILCVSCDVRCRDEPTAEFWEIRHVCLGTTNMREVVTYLEEHPEVDIIVSRIAQDDAVGWEVLKQTKARFPLLTAILCSDYPIEEALRGKPDGVVDPDYLLQKPVDSKKLSEIIHTIGRQIL